MYSMSDFCLISCWAATIAQPAKTLTGNQNMVMLIPEVYWKSMKTVIDLHLLTRKQERFMKEGALVYCVAIVASFRILLGVLCADGVQECGMAWECVFFQTEVYMKVHGYMDESTAKAR